MKTLRLLVVALLFTVTPVFSRDMNESEVISEAAAGTTNRISDQDLEIDLPDYVFSHTNAKIGVKFKNASHPKLAENNSSISFIVNGQDFPLKFDEQGHAYINYTFKSDEKLVILFEDFRFEAELNVIPIVYVLIPIGLLLALLAIKMIRGKRNEGEDSIKPIGKEKSEKSERREKILEMKEVIEKEEGVFS